MSLDFLSIFTNPPIRKEFLSYMDVTKIHPMETGKDACMLITWYHRHNKAIKLRGPKTILLLII